MVLTTFFGLKDIIPYIIIIIWICLHSFWYCFPMCSLTSSLTHLRLFSTKSWECLPRCPHRTNFLPRLPQKTRHRHYLSPYWTLWSLFDCKFGMKCSSKALWSSPRAPKSSKPPTCSQLSYSSKRPAVLWGQLNRQSPNCATDDPSL